MTTEEQKPNKIYVTFPVPYIPYEKGLVIVDFKEVNEAFAQSRRETIEEIMKLDILKLEDAPKVAEQTFELTLSNLEAASSAVEVHARNDLRNRLIDLLEGIKR